MYKVEITEGWNGKSLKSETVKTVADANQWIVDRVPRAFRDSYWRHTVHFPRIIDFGSWTYFGRITELEGPSDTEPSKEKQNKRNKRNKRNKPMSKKKPYSRVECGRLLRALRRNAEKAIKKYTKDGAPEWYIRLVEENAELAERMLKLSDFLYVQETKDSPPVLSDDANAVCPKALKLLIKQAKAMSVYDKILISRIELGWPKGEPCAKKAKKAK